MEEPYVRRVPRMPPQREPSSPAPDGMGQIIDLADVLNGGSGFAASPAPEPSEQPAPAPVPQDDTLGDVPGTHRQERPRRDREASRQERQERPDHRDRAREEEAMRQRAQPKATPPPTPRRASPRSGVTGRTTGLPPVHDAPLARGFVSEHEMAELAKWAVVGAAVLFYSIDWGTSTWGVPMVYNIITDTEPTILWFIAGGLLALCLIVGQLFLGPTVWRNLRYHGKYLVRTLVDHETGVEIEQYHRIRFEVVPFLVYLLVAGIDGVFSYCLIYFQFAKKFAEGLSRPDPAPASTLHIAQACTVLVVLACLLLPIVILVLPDHDAIRDIDQEDAMEG